MMMATEAQRMQATTEHLTADQVDDHLIGGLDEAEAASLAAHLAVCAVCAARVAEAAAPMASFGAVSLAWSERQSAAMAIPQVAATRPMWERRMVWSLAVAACAVGLGLAGAGRHSVAVPHAASAMAEAGTADFDSSERVVRPSPDQLSHDNQMLNAIDSELSASNETPASLGLVQVATQPVATRAAFVRTAVQD